MGTQLIKGFENRLGTLEQKCQKMVEPKCKPGPGRKKPDGSPAGTPSKTTDGGQGTEKLDASSGNTGRLPKDGQPPWQLDK